MRAQAAHEWSPAPFRELDGQRLVVVGYGPIGQEVVRLAEAFRMDPVIVRRAAHGDEPCQVRPLAELTDAVSDADAVVVALPLTDTTRGIVSADVIAAMASHAMFVNVGRGELVDQVALTDALTSGRLGGAGLDVFATEPLPADDPLWDLPNVIISPAQLGGEQWVDATGRRDLPRQPRPVRQRRAIAQRGATTLRWLSRTCGLAQAAIGSAWARSFSMARSTRRRTACGVTPSSSAIVGERDGLVAAQAEPCGHGVPARGVEVVEQRVDLIAPDVAFGRLVGAFVTRCAPLRRWCRCCRRGDGPSTRGG